MINFLFYKVCDISFFFYKWLLFDSNTQKPSHFLLLFVDCD